MKIFHLFLIIAGVIALEAVTAAREMEIVKRDIAAPEDESKSLAEDPSGEPSSLAQLTRQEALVAIDAINPQPSLGQPILDPLQDSSTDRVAIDAIDHQPSLGQPILDPLQDSSTDRVAIDAIDHQPSLGQP